MHPATKQKSSDFDALNRLYLGEIIEEELTDHQVEKLRQVRLALSMFLNARTSSAVTKKLRKEFGISQASAWRTVQLTESLFGSLRRANKEFRRGVAENLALKAYRMAKKEKDFRGMNGALANLIKLNGLDREDPDLPDFSKIQPSLNIIVINPEIESRVKDLLSQGPLDLAELRRRKQQVIDAPHTEIPADGKDAG